MASTLAAAAVSQAACRACLPRACPQQPVSSAPRVLAPRGAACRRRESRASAARADDEVEPVPPAMLSQLDSDEELQTEAEWLAGMVSCWANEEWAAEELLALHADLGAATGKAYLRVRQQEDVVEMGDLVLSLATDMMTSFDFGPSFTSAFEVSNKVVELLMLRDGCDVCCTSDSDRTAIARFEAQLAAAQQP